jgi:hypothetical protein
MADSQRSNDASPEPVDMSRRSTVRLKKVTFNELAYREATAPPARSRKAFLRPTDGDANATRSGPLPRGRCLGERRDGVHDEESVQPRDVEDSP